MAIHMLRRWHILMCNERFILLGEYNSATADYAQIVDQRQRRMGVSSKAEYEHLKYASENARTAAELARIRLEEHVTMHECDS